MERPKYLQSASTPAVSPAASGLRGLWWRLASGVAVAGIVAYQKYLSPRKGFSCPRRMLHGGASCSEFVRLAIAQHGLPGAVPLARLRFGECHAAGRAIRAERGRSGQDGEEQDDKKKGRRRGGGGLLPECDWACCALEGLSDVLDCGLLDAIDCGSIDCGSIDCIPWN